MTPRRWLAAAATIAGAVSTPHVDVAGADADLERLVRGSRLWSACAAFASKLQATWMDSRCRRMLTAAAGVRR